MPVWAFLLVCGWMLAIPYFTKESLKSIFQLSPNVEDVPAKSAALVAGVFWPIFLAFGLWRLMNKKD